MIEASIPKNISDAVKSLQQGGLIAYPTESVYGLGCDPFNHDAVTKLLVIKNRPIKKGFILIAANWQQVEDLVEPIDPILLLHVRNTWPGPITWVFPAKTDVPKWIIGDYRTIALRITAHPIARNICQRFGGPIISSSANLDGQPPLRDNLTLRMTFGNKLNTIVEGQVGPGLRPTEMRDAITGEVIRSA